MCPPPPSETGDMQCVLHRQVAAEAIKAKKVDQHPCPQPGEDAQLLAHTVVLPYPQSEKLKVFPSLLGSNAKCDGLLVTDEQEGLAVIVFLLPSHFEEVFPPIVFPILASVVR
jgi:hypothetical protein